MGLDDYQKKSVAVAQFDITKEEGKLVTLMGLTGEVGELATEYKKRLRDGSGYGLFKEKLIEELGDILWYMSAIAEHEGLKLSHIAKFNLNKINDRWESNTPNDCLVLYDDVFPDYEQIPRVFTIEFKEMIQDGKKYISTTYDGDIFGDPLRDNTYDTDFYRFHDVFHFSYAVVLGWSPVVRQLLKRKRKSNTVTDEVEDGGRAGVIDEAISSLVFEYAKKHHFFEYSEGIDYSLIRTIKELTAHLEVRSKTGKEWGDAILLGFKNWRELKKNSGGIIDCNLENKTMEFRRC